MMIRKLRAWYAPVCVALAIAVAGGLAGCSGRSAEDPAAPAADTQTDEVAVEAETVRELGPEEEPLNALDAARRDFIRGHEAVVRALGESPRLTHESDQETPRFNITIYTAETLDLQMRVRLNWQETDGTLTPLRMDIQHREDGGFQRAWVASE